MNNSFKSTNWFQNENIKNAAYADPNKFQVKT